MTFFSDAHFLRPAWLLLVGVALLMALWQRSARKGRSPWQQVVDPHLMPYLLGGIASTKKKLLRNFGFPIFLSLIAIALAGPTVKKIPDQSSLIKKPLVVIVELSSHMLAGDVSPSRLKRAIFKLGDLLREQKGREVALIAFAGDAHVVVPVTEDHRTILSLAESLSPTLMPIMGTKLSSALGMLKDFPDAHILIISSSNLSDPPAQIRQFIEQNQRPLSFWWFATMAGAPMLTNEGNFSRSRDGSVSMSALRADLVEELAAFSGVMSHVVSPDNQDVLAISQSLDGHMQAKLDGTSSSYDTWYDLGPYVLALAMILFLGAAFIQGELWWMAAMFVFAPMPDAKAALFERWFLRPDQRAYEELLNNRPVEAAELYSDNFSKGTALVKAQKYEEAIKYLQSANSSDGFYNLGNALAHVSKIKEAIEAYDRALKLDANNRDAQANKELLEKLLEDQKDQKDQKDQSSQKSPEQDQEQKPQPEQKSPEQSEEKNPSQQSKPEQAQQEDQRESSKAPPKKEPEASENKAEPGEQRDKNIQYLYDQLERNKDHYLKRKFHYESRRRQGEQK